MDNELYNECRDALAAMVNMDDQINNADNKTKEKILGLIINNLNEEATIYKGYSGKGMFGRRCYGISCQSSGRVIELAGCIGLRGAAVDSLGLGTIVYWPDMKCY